jgi:hypothetical protein
VFKAASSAHAKRSLDGARFAAPREEWTGMKTVDWERAAVLLVDCEAQLLYGVFVPSQVGLDLEPSALGGGFPAQAEVRPRVLERTNARLVSGA